MMKKQSQANGHPASPLATPGQAKPQATRLRLWLRRMACALCLLSCVAPAGADDSPSELVVQKAMDDLASQDWILQYMAMTEVGRWRTKQAVAPLRAIYSGNSQPWIKGRALVALAEILKGEALAEV